MPNAATWEDAAMTMTADPGPTFRFHPKLWIGAAMLLAFPVLGMLMSEEVNWGIEDVAAFALILALLCAGLEAAVNWLTAPRWRIGAALLAVLLFLTVWAHLAVGLFD
jgi:hypothetical protein